MIIDEENKKEYNGLNNIVENVKKKRGRPKLNETVAKNETVALYEKNGKIRAEDMENLSSNDCYMLISKISDIQKDLNKEIIDILDKRLPQINELSKIQPSISDEAISALHSVLKVIEPKNKNLEVAIKKIETSINLLKQEL
jgi:hypothetical protein